MNQYTSIILEVYATLERLVIHLCSTLLKAKSAPSVRGFPELMYKAKKGREAHQQREAHYEKIEIQYLTSS